MYMGFFSLRYLCRFVSFWIHSLYFGFISIYFHIRVQHTSTGKNFPSHFWKSSNWSLFYPIHRIHGTGILYYILIHILYLHEWLIFYGFSCRWIYQPYGNPIRTCWLLRCPKIGSQARNRIEDSGCWTQGPGRPENLRSRRFFTKVYMGVSKNRGPPEWMVKIMENPIKMDDLGGKPHYFRKHPYKLEKLKLSQETDGWYWFHFMHVNFQLNGSDM